MAASFLGKLVGKVVRAESESTQVPLECACCGTRVDPGGNLYYGRPDFKALSCPKCGFVFLDRHASPLEEEDSLDRFWFSLLDHRPHWLERKKRRFVDQLEFIEEHAGRRGGKLLDAGCGCGWFLEVAGQRGWSCYGQDISEEFLEHAGQFVRRDHLYREEIEELPLLAEFDLITMMGVIEHVGNPRVFLQHVARLVKPGGNVFLETPIRDSLFHRLNELALRLSGGRIVRPSLSPGGHRFLFNCGCLRALLQDCGFTVVTMRRAMSPFFEIVNKQWHRKGILAKLFTAAVLIPTWFLSRLLGQENQIWLLAKKNWREHGGPAGAPPAASR